MSSLPDNEIIKGSVTLISIEHKLHIMSSAKHPSMLSLPQHIPVVSSYWNARHLSVWKDNWDFIKRIFN